MFRTIRASALVVATTLAAVLVGAAPATTAQAETPSTVARTTLTIRAPGCDGCRITLDQGVWTRHDAKVWQRRAKTVRDGEVTFRVPTRRTHGMSMLVDAPWDGQLEYVTTVAFRYAGLQPGDHVGARVARHKHRASACWAGTNRDAITLPLTIRKVRVPGVRHRVWGTLAYATTTRHWMVPMRQAWRGVLGSQDVNICGRR
jgi:hypothetical protein